MHRAKFRTKLECISPHYAATAFAEIPASVLAKLGGGARIPIIGTINDFAFRTTTSRMNGRVMFCVNQQMRDGGSTAVGDVARFEIVRDAKPGAISVPTDVKKAMGKKIFAKFNAMSNSHKKEWVRAIEEAKKPETRKNRIEKLVAKMKASE